MSRVLVIAEHNQNLLNPSTAKCVTCARSFEAETIDIVVLAKEGDQIAAQAATLEGVTTVIRIDHPANEFMLAAVKQYKDALDYASQALQKDEELRKIAGKEDEELQPKELTVCGSQLVVDFAEYSLRDVNSKKKLRKVLLDYIPKRDQGDRDSGLRFPPDSVEDNDGNSVELAIKRSGDLIPRLKKGKVLFVSYYFYEGEVYKVPLNSDEPVTAIGKEFNGETYITGYVQGNQELDWSDRGEGQGGGSLSWAFLVNDKSQSMSHLGIDAEIDGESETEIIDDMVDDVFACLEEYL